MTGCRVAHLVDGPGLPDGPNGVERSAHALADAQVRLGVSARVFAEYDLPAGQDVSARAAFVRLVTGSGNDALVRQVFEWEPTVLHLHSVHVPRNLVAAAEARRRGCAYCVTPHGGLSLAARRRSRWRKRVFSALWERRYLNAAAFVHALTAAEASDLREYGLTAPVVIAPNGLSTPDVSAVEPYERVAPADARVLVFVGRLDQEQKGLDLLLRGLALSRAGQLRLVLVGPDSRHERRALEHAAGSLGVASQVVFAGPAFGEDKWRWLRTADVFVHTSRWEGLSLAVLDAAVFGVPLLVSKAADPDAMFERLGAALVVEPDAEAIATALRTLAALPADRLKEIGRRGQQLVTREFSWDRTAARLADAYAGHVPAAPSGVPDLAERPA